MHRSLPLLSFHTVINNRHCLFFFFCECQYKNITSLIILLLNLRGLERTGQNRMFRASIHPSDRRALRCWLRTGSLGSAFLCDQDTFLLHLHYGDSFTELLDDLLALVNYYFMIQPLGQTPIACKCALNVQNNHQLQAELTGNKFLSTISTKKAFVRWPKVQFQITLLNYFF